MYPNEVARRQNMVTMSRVMSCVSCLHGPLVLWLLGFVRWYPTVGADVEFLYDCLRVAAA